MSEWPMQGHFRYLRFKTFSMTPITPQCEVFWALLLNSKHSGVPEDSKSLTLGVLGFTPTLCQSGVVTMIVILATSQNWEKQKPYFMFQLVHLVSHFEGCCSPHVSSSTPTTPYLNLDQCTLIITFNMMHTYVMLM
jgi:hypothetical protein